MAAKQPTSKPAHISEILMKIVQANGLDLSKEKFIEIGIRGRYLDSMGVPGKNDRGMYDDACYILTMEEIVTYNFNMDASAYRFGKGKGAEKGMAMLATGVWDYKMGLHKGYEAFVQAGPVLVLRDGTKGSYPDWGYFGINQHRGGNTGTSSLGCQTWPVSQWSDAKNYMYGRLKTLNKKSFKYIVIDETEIRKGNFTVPTWSDFRKSA